MRTPEELRRLAFTATKKFMRESGREVQMKLMSNKEKIIFSYIYSTNKEILKRIPLAPKQVLMGEKLV